MSSDSICITMLVQHTDYPIHQSIYFAYQALPVTSHLHMPITRIGDQAILHGGEAVKGLKILFFPRTGGELGFGPGRICITSFALLV